MPLKNDGPGLKEIRVQVTTLCYPLLPFVKLCMLKLHSKGVVKILQSCSNFGFKVLVPLKNDGPGLKEIRVQVTTLCYPLLPFV